MILGIGTDICDVRRARRSIQAGRFEALCAKVLTRAEQAYCGSAPDPAKSFAARFAAKEAWLKALGAPAAVALRDIEVHRASGPPIFRLGPSAQRAAEVCGATRFHLSLSHDGDYALAFVLAERA